MHFLDRLARNEMINYLLAGYTCMLLSRMLLLHILKIKVLKKYFRNNIGGSNNLDPDHARQNVAPDLNANCLKRLPVG